KIGDSNFLRNSDGNPIGTVTVLDPAKNNGALFETDVGPFVKNKNEIAAAFQKQCNELGKTTGKQLRVKTTNPTDNLINVIFGEKHTCVPK
ncbi:MAG: hypothetical protein Q8R36_00940, partial [bacterium]|nr:hypothetical protein [bacterium]